MIGASKGLEVRSKYSDFLRGVSAENYERTVSRGLVRRASVAEVMITGWHRLDDDCFVMFAQLPRAHSFYGPVGGVHDPLLLVEVARQATFLACHAGLDVPLNSSFLMNAVDYRIDPDALCVDQAPATLEIFLDGMQRNRRRGTLSDMQGELYFFRDGRPAAQMLTRLSCLRSSVYQRLRGNRVVVPAVGLTGPLPPVSPELVGRDNGADVVLAPMEGGSGWLLRVDQTHPVLFDHPVDHVAGMVLLEAMRQAAQFVSHPVRVLPVGLESAFFRFVEFDEECVVRAEALQPGGDGEVPVRVVVEQGGELAAEGVVVTRRIG